MSIYKNGDKNMMLSDKKAGKLRLGLHKLDDEEIQILGELVGFSKYNFYVHTKDDFITEIIMRIDSYIER